MLLGQTTWLICNDSPRLAYDPRLSQQDRAPTDRLVSPADMRHSRREHQERALTPVQRHPASLEISAQAHRVPNDRRLRDKRGQCEEKAGGHREEVDLREAVQLVFMRLGVGAV